MKTQECNSPVKSLVDFVSQCQGLSFLESGSGELTICQRVDGKHFTLQTKNIEKVLYRFDIQNQPFLQVNFIDNKKILLTNELIGFKPVVCEGLEMTRLPKVVTTPDLLSFIEVLESSVYENALGMESEISDVRLYFNSVLKGAENIGFNLTCERIWIERLLNNKIPVATA